MKRLFFILSASFICLTATSAHAQCCDLDGDTYNNEGLQEGEYEGQGCCHSYFRGTHQIKEPYGDEASYPSQRSGDLYDQLSQ